VFGGRFSDLFLAKAEMLVDLKERKRTNALNAGAGSDTNGLCRHTASSGTEQDSGSTSHVAALAA
jgi:hypothetical protein